MSDPKGAAFGLCPVKKEGTTISIGKDMGEPDPRSHLWTYLEVRVPRHMEHELYDLVIAKIKETGWLR